MRTSRSTLAVVALAATAFSAGCTRDLPTQSGVPDQPEAVIQTVSLEIVSYDEFGAVMRVDEPGRESVFLTIRSPDTAGEEPSGLENANSVMIGDGSAPREWLLPAVILALKVYSVVETIRVCAIPVYQDIRRSNSVSQTTVTECATQAAINVSGGILARIASPVIKVTALRSSIKSMVGNVITHRQLQRVINKQSKASITELVRQMTAIFYSELMSGYTKVFNANGIK